MAQKAESLLKDGSLTMKDRMFKRNSKRPNFNKAIFPQGRITEGHKTFSGLLKYFFLFFLQSLVTKTNILRREGRTTKFKIPKSANVRKCCCIFEASVERSNKRKYKKKSSASNCLKRSKLKKPKFR